MSAAPNDAAAHRSDATGVVGGLLSGLLGIGGGTIMVPLLVLWSGVGQRAAHALSLGAIVPISLVAVVIYGGAGEVNVRDGAALAAGAVVGARIGAGALARAPDRLLKAAFGAFMFVAAASICLKG